MYLHMYSYHDNGNRSSKQKQNLTDNGNRQTKHIHATALFKFAADGSCMMVPAPAVQNICGSVFVSRSRFAT